MDPIEVERIFEALYKVDERQRRSIKIAAALEAAKDDPAAKGKADDLAAMIEGMGYTSAIEAIAYCSWQLSLDGNWSKIGR